MTMTVVVVHEPGPFPDEAPFTRYCTGCEAVWPCPDRLAELEPAPPAPRRSLEPGERAIVAKVAMWWHVEGHAGLAFFAQHGGTVVGYDDVEDERVFRVLVWHKRKPHLVAIARADLEPAGCHEPDISVLRGHAENLARCALATGNDGVRKVYLQLAAACQERVSR